MSTWKEVDDNKLLSLAHQNLSVEEIHDSFPQVSAGTIAVRLNSLKKRKKLSSDFKIRMKKWDENELIKFAEEGLSPSEISKKYPKTSIGTVIGRLYNLKKEGKISANYCLTWKIPLLNENKQIEEIVKEETISRLTIQNKGEQYDRPWNHNSLIGQKNVKSFVSIPIIQETNIENNVSFQLTHESDVRIRKVSRPRYTIVEFPVNAEENKISFLDLLTKNIEHYKGCNRDIQKYCPKFFELLSNILNDKFVDWHTKVMISAALGYFVLEADVIPDTEASGYVDDLYIVTYVLNEIKNNQSPEIIIRNWNGEEDIICLIDEIFTAASNIVGPLSKQILQTVGLYKFSLLSLEEYSGEYPKKVARLLKEKRDLISLLAYIIQKVEDSKFKSRSYSEIKKFVESNGNYDEIQRIIEISKLYHEIEVEPNDKDKKFKEKLERKMREARVRGIMKKKERTS
jgi:uncharacterized membrane protein YkvA (DUF1232 family)